MWQDLITMSCCRTGLTPYVQSTKEGLHDISMIWTFHILLSSQFIPSQACDWILECVQGGKIFKLGQRHWHS
jgi:hypothetical protein